MLAELLALGILGVGVLVVALVIICALVDHDSLWWPFLVIIALGAGYEFLQDGSLLTEVKAWTVNGVAWTILSYLVIGLGVFSAKWMLFLKERKEKYKETKSQYVSENGRIDTESKKSEFIRHLRFNGVMGRNDDGITPLARNYKRRIGAWIVWWPATLLNALFRDLAKHLYYLVRDAVDKVSIRFFKSTEEDFQNLGR